MTTSTRAEAGLLDDVDLYVDLYRRMRLIRGFEDLVQSLFLRGEIYGTTHLYSGQEAVAVGFASVLDERDRVAATYRGHGHALALGDLDDAWRIATPDNPILYSPPPKDAHVPGAERIVSEIAGRLER